MCNILHNKAGEIMKKSSILFLKPVKSVNELFGKYSSSNQAHKIIYYRYFKILHTKCGKIHYIYNLMNTVMRHSQKLLLFLHIESYGVWMGYY